MWCLSRSRPHSRRPRRTPTRRFCQVVASQKFVSEVPIAISRPQRSMRHTFRNECNERTLEPRIRVRQRVRSAVPLQPSCCLTVCTDPYIRLHQHVGTHGPAPPIATPRATRRSKILCCCGTARNEPPTESGRHRDEIATHATGVRSSTAQNPTTVKCGGGKLDMTVRQLAPGHPVTRLLSAFQRIAYGQQVEKLQQQRQR